MEVGYALTDSVKLGIFGEGMRETERSFVVEAYGLNATVQATDQEDNWWFSSGIFAEYGIARNDDDEDSFLLAFLLEREDGAFDTLFNIAAERGEDDRYSVTSALDVTYGFADDWGLGVQWFADYDTDDLGSRDVHYVGPVLKHEMEISEKSELEVELGQYFGITDDAANSDTRLVVGYEIEL